jgi:predicted DsbA family dithiol-disulfide isomerase
LNISWIAFPLHPETPEEGTALEDLFRGRLMDIPGMMARLKKVAEEEGLALGDRKMTYNSRLAQELSKWAESKGFGPAYHDAMFKAYFADGKNIAKISELLLITESLGLDEGEARQVLEKRTYKEAVDADWQRSRAQKVTAVPTFFVGSRNLVGAQSYATLEKFVQEGNVEERS